MARTKRAPRAAPRARSIGHDAASQPGRATDTDGCPEDDYDEHSRWAAAKWPEVEEVVESIVSRIDMAQRHFERASVATRDQVGLAHGELKVLLRLTRGVRSQGEMAKNLLVSTGTMTNQLDKLEGAGLVVRHPDPADRRGKVVEMTAKGRDVLDTYVNVQARRERELVGGLNTKEKSELNVLLRKLLASLHDEAEA
ncbi:MAG TPA: MarR family transcriptional regulator [Acidimicrobiales bacterium]|jgi:DNA-binding MarR family transcriptional regulator|nr:MarR family transcriptional regulator [Acidimicrobiales bacterium]